MDGSWSPYEYLYISYKAPSIRFSAGLITLPSPSIPQARYFTSYSLLASLIHLEVFVMFVVTRVPGNERAGLASIIGSHFAAGFGSPFVSPTRKNPPPTADSTAGARHESIPF